MRLDSLTICHSSHFRLRKALNSSQAARSASSMLLSEDKAPDAQVFAGDARTGCVSFDGASAAKLAGN